MPEKDGILACLLACEMCARRGVGLAVQLRDFWSRYGRLAHRRIDLGLADGIGDTVRKLFIENTPPSLGISQSSGSIHATEGSSSSREARRCS